MISRVEYGGWKDNIRLANDQIELIITTEVGPRIIRAGFIDGANVMKNFTAQMGGKGESEWQIRGGHRLWSSPEGKPRSYSLDNSPVTVEELGPYGVRLISPPEVENGIQKEMEITLAAGDNHVTVVHRITNLGAWDIELAPWALTVLDEGGIEIVPLPEKRPHTEVLLPDFPLVIWPYMDMSDSRLRWGKRYITLKQDVTKSPTKFGMGNQLGWAAYLVHGTLLVKYFDYDPNCDYPDGGCNFETFTNEEFLELESLGPLTILEPGEAVEHVESWRLFNNITDVSSDEEIDCIVRPLVEG